MVEPGRGVLMFRSSTASPPSSPLEDPTDAPSLTVLEDGFRRWVEGRSRPEMLHLGDDPAVHLPLEQVLRRLTASTEPLWPADGRRLGLAADVRIADAAQRLLHARLDPGGPRCRSFRAASYFLVGLAHITVDDLDDGTAATRVDELGVVHG
jgi:hypothetical protein